MFGVGPKCIDITGSTNEYYNEFDIFKYSFTNGLSNYLRYSNV